MKKSIIALGIIASFITIISCSTKPKGDEASVSEEQVVDSAKGIEVLINTELSKVGFVGNGVGKNHPGSFKISSGKFIVDNGMITGGSVLIDIKSLALDEKENMFQAKLLPHLLSADFFDAEKFASAKFEITSMMPYTDGKDSIVTKNTNYLISGNLTLKEVTKNVTFSAKIDSSKGTYSAVASFNIDRTLWGIKYGNDKSLKDKFISEVVNISLDIKSK